MGEEHATTEPQHEYLAFDVGQHRYAMPVSAVERVTEIANAIQVPRPQGVVCAVGYLAERLIPIVDADQDVDGDRHDTYNRRVVLTRIGADLVGWYAEGHFTVNTYSDADTVPAKDMPPWVIGVVVEDGASTYLLDPQHLPRAESLTCT